MKRAMPFLVAALALLSLTGRSAEAAETILSFTTMFGVDGGFVKHNPIRGVQGDELPWELTSASGSLNTDGHLVLTIRGLVFANDPSVPPELRGINDETEFRALVSCLTSEGKGKGGRGKVQTVNIKTGGFPATPAGDSDIDTTINLPDQCVAPIIFVLAGSEDLWFAVNGFERE